MLVASVGWAVMVMPMSLVRVVMGQIGFTTTQSLRVIELHFLGMYFPGFFTGNMIKQIGYKEVCYLSVLVLALAEAFAFLPGEDDDSILLWSISLILVGVGWSFAFTASTVWVMHKVHPSDKANRQAANDAIMFLLAGGALFTSSYIFEAGGSELDGWHTLNWVVIGLLAFGVLLLVVDFVLERQWITSRNVAS
jgi:MFS family permease